MKRISKYRELMHVVRRQANKLFSAQAEIVVLQARVDALAALLPPSEVCRAAGVIRCSECDKLHDCEILNRAFGGGEGPW